MKEVQSLTGKVAALNRFVSRTTDKCMPFFKVLKKAFQWNDECEEALAKLKEYLAKPPLLSSLVMGEKLFLLSSILHYSKFDTDQRRREHLEANLLYQSGIPRSRSKLRMDGEDSLCIIGRLQKASFLFPSTPHCCHDKLAYKKDDEQDRCSETTHSMVIELGQFDIKYWPRAAIKAQVLANFIAKFTYPCKEE